MEESSRMNNSKNLACETFHDSLQHLLEPINSEYGIELLKFFFTFLYLNVGISNIYFKMVLFMISNNTNFNLIFNSD